MTVRDAALPLMDVGYGSGFLPQIPTSSPRKSTYRGLVGNTGIYYMGIIYRDHSPLFPRNHQYKSRFLSQATASTPMRFVHRSPRLFCTAKCSGKNGEISRVESSMSTEFRAGGFALVLFTYRCVCVDAKA